MTVKELLEKYRETPIEESLRPIAQCLAGADMIVALEDLGPGEFGFRVAADGDDQLWLYMFTDETEFSRVFPDGGKFGELSFVDLLNIVEADEQFGGMFLNSKSDAPYVIPRQLFGRFREVLEQPLDA